jgi:uroporphyrinogen decarboxylase
MGLDWRVWLDDAWQKLDWKCAVQGNLDPASLLADWPTVSEKAAEILQRAGGRAGHIFNLGHGIFPETPVENVKRLVEFVHDQTVRPASLDEPPSETAASGTTGDARPIGQKKGTSR